MYKESKKNFKLSSKNVECIKTAVDELKSYYDSNLIEVNLYGSYAKGKNRRYSSIDLLIIIEKSNERLIKRISSVSRMLNLKKDYIFQIEPLIYTRDEILELIEKRESFIISAVSESILLYSNEKNIDLNYLFDNIENINIEPSRFKNILPELEELI